jgi:hypothetical protein
MGSRWNFCCGAEERKTTRQISGGLGWIGFPKVFGDLCYILGL